MDAIKNAANKVASKVGNTNTGSTAAPQSTTGAGVGTHAGNAQYDWKDTAVDQGQAHGILPATGTQQGNIIDQGQKYYDSYEKTHGQK
ncbi:hypothetical protein HDV00_011431 [Rhizophlyctis rosea]|nr:hypothetical protein HDV00_011431 [Rhizophlyctis rosea]